MTKRLKVLILFDAAEPRDPSKSAEEILGAPDCKAESDVYGALKSWAHEVLLLPLTDRAEAILEEIHTERPDIVFNQVEQFDGDTSLEKNVIALLEMLKMPVTGSGPAVLMICKNKSLAKEILSHQRIKTPEFQLLPKGGRVVAAKRLKYPIMVKPLREEASYGISQRSLVENDKAFVERVRFVHESMGQDVVAEEYVEGRELYVGVLGSRRLQVLPPREMVFGEVPEDEPKIATFKAKWDDKYRKKWGIQNVFANGLQNGVLKNLEKTCKKVYGFLYLKGYARMDIRLTPANEVFFIEANPNPFIAKDEDFALSASKAGISYEALIQKILNYGLEEAT